MVSRKAVLAGVGIAVAGAVGYLMYNVYAQIVLRGNNPDSLGFLSHWALLIKEKGMMSAVARFVSIDGSSLPFQFEFISRNGSEIFYQTSNASDLIFGNLIVALNDSPEYVFHVANEEDYLAQTFFLYVNIVIIGA